MANNLDMSKLIDLNDVAAIRDWVRGNFLLKSDAEKMMASKVRITFGSDFEGQTYTLSGGGETYTGTVPTELIVEQTIKSLGITYTVSCATAEGDTYSNDITIGNYYGIYPAELMSFRAYLACTADAGATVKATLGSKVYSGTASSEGKVTLQVGSVGTYSLTATLNGETTKAVEATITTNGETVDVKLPSLILEIVPWSTGTDEQIVAMIEAARAGTIDLQTDGNWKVGDVRTITVGAFTDGGSTAHAEQSIDIVISQFGDYMNCGCVMQFDFKDELATGVRMNSSNTNAGGWGESEMYKTTMPALVEALPTWLKGLLLEFSVLASAGSQSATINTVTGNKLALRSEIEIFGTITYSKAGEGSQIEYYKTSANRIKKRGHSGSANYWWERSPYGSNSDRFCIVGSDGSANINNARDASGVAPFGCI